MGNTENTLGDSILLKTYNEREWVPADPTNQLWTLRNPELWKNRFTGKMVEVHCFGDLNKLQIYEFRKLNNDFLVEVVHVLPPDSNTKLCMKRIHSQSYLVLVEAIRTKLTEVSEVSEEEAMYILGSSLRGAVLLSKFYPEFVLDEKLIFVNYEGKVKVWINEDYASNEALVQSQLKNADSTLYQTRIKSSLQSLFTSIQSKIEKNFIGQRGFSLIDKKKVPFLRTYQDAIEYLDNIYPYRPMHLLNYQTPFQSSFHEQTFACPLLKTCMPEWPQRTQSQQPPHQNYVEDVQLLQFSRNQKRKTNKLHKEGIPIHKNKIIDYSPINRSLSSSSFLKRHSPSPFRRDSVSRIISPPQKITFNGKQITHPRKSIIMQPQQQRIANTSYHKHEDQSHTSLSPKTQQSSTYTPIKNTNYRKCLFDDVSQQKASKRSSPIGRGSQIRKSQNSIIRLSNLNKDNTVLFDGTFRQSSRAIQDAGEKENFMRRSQKKMSIDRCVSVSIIRNEHFKRSVDNDSDVLRSNDKIALSSAQFGEQDKSGNIQFSFNGTLPGAQSRQAEKSLGEPQKSREEPEIPKTPQKIEKFDCGIQYETEEKPKKLPIDNLQTRESHVNSQAVTVKEKQQKRVENEHRPQQNSQNRSLSSATIKIELDYARIQECLSLDRESMNSAPRTSIRKSESNNRRLSNLELERLQSEFFKYSNTDRSQLVVNQTPVQTVQSVVDTLQDPLDLSERLYMLKRGKTQQELFSGRLGSMRDRQACQSTRTIIQNLQSFRSISPFNKNGDNFRDYMEYAVQYFEARKNETRKNEPHIQRSNKKPEKPTTSHNSVERKEHHVKSLHKGQIDRIDQKYNKYVVNRQGINFPDKYNTISSVKKSRRAYAEPNYYF